jgi:ATP-dependent Zn protease
VTMVIDPRRNQAVHEAGHAVVGSLLGLHVEETGFNPENEDDEVHFPASTRFEEGDPCALISAQPDVMVVVMMAGSVAERVVLGQELPHGHTGDITALQLCYPDLPTDPKPVFDPAIRRAWELVDQHRGAVEAVASGLLEKGCLAGADVERIIANRSL